MRSYSGTVKGIDIGSLCEKLVAEAKSLQDSVSLVFNEITLIATPHTNAEKLVEFYFTSSQDKKKS